MKSLMTIVFVMSCYVSQGQGIKDYSFTGGVYWNTYALSDLKDYQSLFNSFLPNTHEISDFTSSLAFDVMIRRSMSFGEIGIWSAYQSADAGSNHTGFLGSSYRTAFELQAIVFGVAYRKSVFNPRLFFEGRVGLAFNKFVFDEVLESPGFFRGLSSEYQSVSPTLWAGLEYQLLAIPKLSLITIVDFSNLGPALKLKEEPIPDFPPNFDDVKVDWTGFKFGVRIGI